MESQLQIANRNIKLYVFIKVFAKRVFLPLSAIYFIDRFGFSIKEIGILAAFFAATQLLAEIPTGYFADRVARVTSIRIAALLNAAATLLYVFTHVKAGVFAGQFLEAIGYCFLVGAGEALIHDSLETKGDAKNYSKVLSRAQSLSLLINAVLMAGVGMTYGIDHRLPFLLGTVAYLSLFVCALFMSDVARDKPARKIKKPSVAMLIKGKHVIGFALLFGIIGALFTAPTDMINLALKDFGIRPDLLGWWFASASILGAVLGIGVHVLRRLSLRKYMMLDSAILLLPFAAAFTRSGILLGVAFVFNTAFWRFRRIIYQDHLLTIYPTRYKATLLSAMSNIEELTLVWMPIVIALIVARLGYSNGLGVIGLFALIIIPLYVLSGARLVERRK